MKNFLASIFLFSCLIGLLLPLSSIAGKDALSLDGARKDSFPSFRGFQNVKKQSSARVRTRERLIHLLGDSSLSDVRSAWDRAYARQDYIFGKKPVEFLRKNIHLLPKGRALDIAMGEGRNAVFLAKKGFLVEGVDISHVGLRKAQMLAAENGVKIRTVNADLSTYKIKKNAYDVIANFYYYQKDLFDKIKAGLRPGGIVIYESYTKEHQKISKTDWLEKHLLKKGELREAFSDLEILHYSETSDGKKAVASLIARKPKG